MKTQKNNILLLNDFKSAFKGLSDEDAGKLIKAIFDYSSGDDFKVSGMIEYAFNIIKPTLDKHKQNYEETCKRNSENAKKRWENKEATECDRIQSDANDANRREEKIKENKIKEDKRKFIPPTYQEVENYAKQRNRLDLAKKFYDYFDVGNWIDSKGNKVKNWKQKFVSWEGNNLTKSNSTQSSGNLNLNYF